MRSKVGAIRNSRRCICSCHGSSDRFDLLLALLISEILRSPFYMLVSSLRGAMGVTVLPGTWSRSSSFANFILAVKSRSSASQICNCILYHPHVCKDHNIETLPRPERVCEDTGLDPCQQIFHWRHSLAGLIRSIPKRPFMRLR